MTQSYPAAKNNLNWKELFKGRYSKNSYVRRRIPQRVPLVLFLLSRHIDFRIHKEIYDMMCVLEKEKKINYEFKKRNLESYFNNLVGGKTIVDKLGGIGLEQKQKLSFLRNIYFFTEYFEKSISKRIYALLGYIYYLDYNFSSFRLTSNLLSPSDQYHTKKFLILWTLIKEKLIAKVAGDVIDLAQIEITKKHLESDSNAKWTDEKDKIRDKEKKMIDGLIYSWSEEGNASFYVPIAEHKDEEGKNQQRFDGLLIIMPDIQGIEDALTEEAKKQWKDDLKQVKQRHNFLLVLFKRKLSSEKKRVDVLTRPFSGLSIIEFLIVFYHTINSSARILFSKILGKGELLYENPFGTVNIEPFELKQIDLGSEYVEDKNAKVEEIKRRITKRIAKHIGKAIKQLSSCDVPSDVGKIAIQLTNNLQTKEVVTEAVRQVVRNQKNYKKEPYNAEIVIFPSYDEAGEYQGTIYTLKLSDFY